MGIAVVGSSWLRIVIVTALVRWIAVVILVGRSVVAPRVVITTSAPLRVGVAPVGTGAPLAAVLIRENVVSVGGVGWVGVLRVARPGVTGGAGAGVRVAV